MRILFVLEHFPPYIGGAEKLFGILSKEYVKSGHEVKVLTTRFDKMLPENEEVEGVEIVRINCKNRYRFSYQAIKPAKSLARWADVIHSSTYNALLPARKASKQTGTPILVTVHEVWGEMWFQMPFLNSIQKLAYFSFEKWVLNLGADKYVAVSDSTKNQLIDFGISPDRIAVVRNGVEAGDRTDIWKPVQAKNFLFYGRLGVSKGIDLILEASKLLLEKGQDFSGTLVLARKPESILKQIRQKIRTYKLEECLIIEHELPQDQLKAKIMEAACVLVPSRAEGFGFAAVEANRMGVPVVHSAKGALAETVSGKHITMETFSPEGLMAGIERAWAGDYDVSPLNEFPIDEMVTKYLDLLESIHKKSPS